MPRRRHEEARRHLRRADPVLRGLVDRVGPCTLSRPRRRDDFAALARAIVHQQLSGRAAGAIHERLTSLLGGGVRPEAILARSTADLRGAGLSYAKVVALRDLACAARDARVRLPVPSSWEDERVVEHLVQVRGIGPWTAQMFLLFHLGRPDVLPTADLGVRTAVRRLYRLRGEPRPARLEEIALPWRPWRSIATWYLWRSLEGEGTVPA